MSQVQQTVAKLEIIKELASDNAVKQVCEVLIDHITSQAKSPLGFHKGES